jgi:membrane peptidoglycan carboxypeptidase
VPCEQVADVGGETFSNQGAASAKATLATDFADGCSTAFANMSQTLTAKQLAATEQSFGIGATWRLRLAAFSGSASVSSDEASVAAQATGTGGVLMSPLALAEVAAAVASGTSHTPTLTAGQEPDSFPLSLSASELTELRQMMRLAVSSGSAHAANVSSLVYGQAGVVKAGQQYLSWFVGYRGSLAVAVLQTGRTASAAAAALAGTFLKTAGS